MTRLSMAVLACVLPLALWTSGTTPTPADAATVAASSNEAVVVDLSRSTLQVGPGEKLSFTSRIGNNGNISLRGYVAHLNILSTDEGVYVDPEDWSPKRTQYLDELGPGKSTTLTWNVQAVTSGPLIVFVSVTSPTSDTVTSSGPLDLTVRGQRVVSSGGVVPLVVWMPAGVLALLGASQLRRRRHR